MAASGVRDDSQAFLSTLRVELKITEVKLLGQVIQIVEHSRTWVSAVSINLAVASWLGSVLVEMAGLPMA